MPLAASSPRCLSFSYQPLRLIYPLVSRSYQISRSHSVMEQPNGINKEPLEQRKLKILMLHGYTQSGPLFHSKTRALEKILLKAFPPTPNSPLASTYPGGVTLTYPTAPIRLLPADVPGFTPSDPESPPEAYGWWKRETGSGNYIGLEQGLSTIADAIREMGDIDGVIGFSQGAAAAAFVASLLEPGRKAGFEAQIQKLPSSFGYQESWKKLAELHPNGLRFAVSYSGFIAPNEEYKGFYEPKIQTKLLNVIGSLDSVVEESRSLALVEACTDGRTVYHPGGHFVPIGKEMANVLVGFVRECCEEKKKEIAVEDMDLPF